MNMTKMKTHHKKMLGSKSVSKTVLAGLALASSAQCLAHYPILDCQLGLETEPEGTVVCIASFSDRSKAPNVLMEIYSEDDEVIASGQTDERATYRFIAPEGEAYFIIMDAGPGHVLEISDEEVRTL